MRDENKRKSNGKAEKNSKKQPCPFQKDQTGNLLKCDKPPHLLLFAFCRIYFHRYWQYILSNIAIKSNKSVGKHTPIIAGRSGVSGGNERIAKSRLR